MGCSWIWHGLGIMWIFILEVRVRRLRDGFLAIQQFRRSETPGETATSMSWRVLRRVRHCLRLRVRRSRVMRTLRLFKLFLRARRNTGSAATTAAGTMD